jgi:uncharacterized protein YbjT (DUF2867 family)
MILVTGATGHVGSQAVRGLCDSGSPVRAFVRDEGRARALLGEGVELAVGDFNDRSSVERALNGATDVLLISANVPQQVEYECATTDLAKAAGVKRIVKVSTVGAAVGSPLAFWDWHGQIEEHLADSGVPSVVLRGNFFMTNVTMMADPIKMMSNVLAPAAGARIGMVDPKDVGRCAAAVLRGDEAGAVHTLTGPESITFEQVAEALSEATGRRIGFVSPPDEMARGGMIAGGVPAEIADILLVLYRVLREGGADLVTDEVQTLTGRQPTSFADFARENASAFIP